MDLSPDMAALAPKRPRESAPAPNRAERGTNDGEQEFSTHLPATKAARTRNQAKADAPPQQAEEEVAEEATDTGAAIDGGMLDADLSLPEDEEAAADTLEIDARHDDSPSSWPAPTQSAPTGNQVVTSIGAASQTDGSATENEIAAPDFRETSKAAPAATTAPTHAGSTDPQRALKSTAGVQAVDTSAPPVDLDIAAPPSLLQRDLQPAQQGGVAHTPAASGAGSTHNGGQSVVSQIAQAILHTSNDRLELTLSPEELGRMRIVIARGDHAPQVTVLFERPEAYDQARRHMSLLAQDLQDSGLQDAQLAFGRDRESDHPAQSWQDRRDESLPQDAPQIVAIVGALGGTVLPGNRHIDIRL